jgi:hypothetical protein
MWQKLEPLYAVGGDEKHAAAMENCMKCFKNIELPYDLESPLLSI